jgi:crotonobetainyl-CoA:carnitine CoA-transferase CaiB-like acyl-CoA transferase
MDTVQPVSPGPLQGIRVLDLATMLAGPMACQLLGDFGADVIKIEHPKVGDSLRGHGRAKDGFGLWWKVASRNKSCIGLYLGDPEGQEILLELVKDADVIVESFRPGTLEKWGLGFDRLREVNPGVILVRVSGFGQTGPYAERAGFGTLAEAMSGFAHRTGDPDGPPTLPPFGLADGVAGLSAAFAIMVALHERKRSGIGQEIDLAIAEPLLTILEPQVTTFDQLGIELVRSGSQATTNAPRGIYQSADDRWVAISASTESTARRLIVMAGRPDVAAMPWMRSAESRVAHSAELDGILVPWFRERSHDEILTLCRQAEAPASLVYAASDIVADEQFAATKAITTVPHDKLGSVRMPNVLFRLSRTPGEIRWPGPDMGTDNAEIYGSIGMDEAELSRLRENGTI